MTLKAKTPNGAAKEFAKYLRRAYPDLTANLIVQDNEIIWEEGPYDWVAVTCGTALTGPESGIYSQSDTDWPDGVSNKHVLAEANNQYSIAFFKN